MYKIACSILFALTVSQISAQHDPADALRYDDGCCLAVVAILRVDVDYDESLYTGSTNGFGTPTFSAALSDASYEMSKPTMFEPCEPSFTNQKVQEYVADGRTFVHRTYENRRDAVTIIIEKYLMEMPDGSAIYVGGTYDSRLTDRYAADIRKAAFSARKASK